MRTLEYDVAVVGAGTAGLFARRAAEDAGARAVLIEGGEVGTTCVRVGCIPSKLMLAAADAARHARGAEVFGVRAGPVSVDGPAVMRRVQAVRDSFLKNLADKWRDLPDDAKLQGWARFTAPGVLAVGDDVEVRARAVVLTIGSLPVVAEALKPAGDLVITHEHVFDLPDLPASIAVVGAGAVGTELALAFARLGVRVTLFDKGEALGGLKDEAVAAVARERLGAEIEMILGVEVEARAENGEAVVSWRGEDGRTGSRRYARVLSAAGRRKPFERLGMDKAGVALDDHGAPKVDPATLRCGEAPVFVAGDAEANLPVLHEARAQGLAAGRAAARPDEPYARDIAPSLAITYTDPDIAAVGEPLSALGDDAEAGESRFEEGRTTIEDRPHGLIRLYARADGRLAGGEMVGSDVEHLSQRMADWLACGLTVDAALALPFYHPTTDEDLRAALQDLAGRLKRRA